MFSLEYTNTMEKHVFSSIHTYRRDGSGRYHYVDDTKKQLGAITDWDGVPVVEFDSGRNKRRTDREDLVILYAHGNKWDLGRLLKRPFTPRTPPRGDQKTDPRSLLQIISEGSKLPVVAFEYPGFGADDEENLSITGSVDAMLAAYKRLIKRGRRVIVFGFSMGTGITAEMVRRLHHDDCCRSLQKPVGMILQSASESVLRTSTVSFPKRMAMLAYRMAGYDVYETSDFIATLTDVPVVGFIHGKHDTRSPIAGAKTMADKVRNNGSPDQKVLAHWDRNADHSDLPARVSFSTFLGRFVLECGETKK